MAEYDPGHQSGAWDESGGYEETEGTEHIQQHSTDQDQAEYSVDQTQDASGDSPSPDGATDDAGDYDPASAVPSAPAPALSPQMAGNQVPLRPSPQLPAKQKPRTAGGFLVGDSDSEDGDEVSVPPSSGLAPGAAPQPSVPSPQHQHPIVAKHSAVISPNTPPAHQANTAAAAPAEGLGNGNIAAPSAPIDRISQLEDRIRNDPRGALDAWLALIAEHRSKNDVEGSRQAYDRFFAVFPQAVSQPPHTSERGRKLTLHRLMFGLNISPWNWT